MLDEIELDDGFEYVEIEIGEVEHLLKEYEMYVDSPDGYVRITQFIDKGMNQEFIVKVEGEEDLIVNFEHRLETDQGWVMAYELYENNLVANILTKSGYKKGYVVLTDREVPIVDISVDHKNRRYYAGNISSHNSGVGKSLTMVSMASNMIRNGYNVLYISMELSEEDIGQRFDANLLSVDIDRLGDLSADSFTSKVNMLMGRSHGQLVIKEYPTGGANVNHFKALLSELKQKTGFTPDVVYIDYVNICSSSLMPKANGTYSVVKSITEELRGLAVQENLCLVTATQTGRGVQETSDIALSDVSESYGLVQTADYILGIIQTEELAKQNKYYVKQLKSRYGDINKRPFWFFGVNKLKMTIYDIESTDYAINETVENIQKINSDRSALHSNQPPLKSRLKF